MEARALKRHVGSSPRKMRLVVDLIRNKRVDEAVGILKYANKSAAKVVEQTVLSAYSNLVNKAEAGRLGKNEVYVKEVFVNGGPSMKRILPAPQGRAFRIRKRSSHLTVIVSQFEEKSNNAKK
jgi:large subunit ribosomal protein L22